MSEPRTTTDTNAEIEDVLSSIRRLISQERAPAVTPVAEAAAPAAPSHVPPPAGAMPGDGAAGRDAMAPDPAPQSVFAPRNARPAPPEEAPHLLEDPLPPAGEPSFADDAPDVATDLEEDRLVLTPALRVEDTAAEEAAPQMAPEVGPELADDPAPATPDGLDAPVDEAVEAFLADAAPEAMLPDTSCLDAELDQLEDKIAAMEAAVTLSGQDFEPEDGGAPLAGDGPDVPQWSDDAEDFLVSLGARREGGARPAFGPAAAPEEAPEAPMAEMVEPEETPAAVPESLMAHRAAPPEAEMRPEMEAEVEREAEAGPLVLSADATPEGAEAAPLPDPDMPADQSFAADLAGAPEFDADIPDAAGLDADLGASDPVDPGAAFVDSPAEPAAELGADPGASFAASAPEMAEEVAVPAPVAAAEFAADPAPAMAPDDRTPADMTPAEMAPDAVAADAPAVEWEDDTLHYDAPPADNPDAGRPPPAAAPADAGGAPRRLHLDDARQQEAAPVARRRSSYEEMRAEDPDPAEEGIFAESDPLLDEEALRILVSDIIREELQGTLGERITRNVRKLVRREIQRALAGHTLE
ncbi:hypothetical protein [Phaeovulum vinaykumarii]|uniref:Uncharacterized protein n=1 Tax=Phaeovulum vinaykumarii TaxID=407234 RepID=A0A1N7JNG5_9RHOB|nr:hypothetical protein [Phaeovulum vinaykumarii]SIS50801.1 hypothetical protein SAMN05421795_101185 [Phaeovulum vinaykumarii]SOB90431.1 hypothetical protein SAMN05878426_101185 [Phaeovulum vinaykumarii]